MGSRRTGADTMQVLSWNEHPPLPRAAPLLESASPGNAESVNSVGGSGSAAGDGVLPSAPAPRELRVRDVHGSQRKGSQARQARRGKMARGARQRAWPRLQGAPQNPLLEAKRFAGSDGGRLAPVGHTMRGVQDDTPIWFMPPTSTFLVDDSPSFLQSAARFLAADERIEIVGVALSAQEALEQVAKLRPDLVLMDLNMPGMNGLEATRLLKARPNPPHVVILTLNDTEEYRLAAQQAHADGFVAKSDLGQKLLPMLESFLRSSSSGPHLEPQPEPVAQIDGAAEPDAPHLARPEAQAALHAPGLLDAAASTCAAAPEPLALAAPAQRAGSVLMAGSMPAGLDAEREVASRWPLQPRALAPQRPLAQPAMVGERRGRERRRVLLAEDQVAISHLMAVNMWRAGIETRIAPDSLSALELLESFEPHLVLLDAGSPHLKAGAVCRSIRDRSQVPILLVATREAAAKGTWCLASTPGLSFLQEMANVEEVFACAEDVGSLTARVLALLSRFDADA